MMPMSRLMLLLLSLSSLLGCNSTGVGNPGAMTVTVINDLTAEPQATGDAEQLADSQLRHAVLAFSELRFMPCDPADAEVVVPGPFVIDLVSGKNEPAALPPVAIAPHGFCGLDAPLTTAAPYASLLGRSVLFSGVRSDGTLFILYAAMQGTLRMIPEPGVVWNESNASSVIWALRPKRWVLPAELDSETTDPLGTALRIVVIDIERHPLLFAAIRNRIGARATLHTDLDRNGKLDDRERTDALIGEGAPSLD